MLRSGETNVVMGVLNNNQTVNIQNNTGQNGSGSSAFDALPKPFVQSMKTLFDILDDQQTGYVKFLDIEKGWQDDGSKGLPRGVIESLRKVTPTNGLLTFERFCAGLKLCLLKNQNQLQTQTENNNIKNISNNINNSNTIGVWKNKSVIKVARPPSAPALDIANPVSNNLWSINIRPHNIFSAHRALSMPQLSPDSEGELTTSSNTVRSQYNSPPPPPKPPRASAVNNNNANKGILSATNKAEIRHALQNWQMGVMRNEKLDVKDKQANNNFVQQCGYRGSADGGSSSATDSGNFTSMPLKKATTKRREPRRHTLQNGIDYNMLKRLKQYEEEREVLLLGLSSVEKAREWYTKQIIGVQEKIKYLGRMGSSNSVRKK